MRRSGTFVDTLLSLNRFLRFMHLDLNLIKEICNQCHNNLTQYIVTEKYPITLYIVFLYIIYRMQPSDTKHHVYKKEISITSFLRRK